jgi:hypothetical protein
VGFPALAVTRKSYFFLDGLGQPKREDLTPGYYSQYFKRGDIITIDGMSGRYIVDQIHSDSVDLLRDSPSFWAMNCRILAPWGEKRNR